MSRDAAKLLKEALDLPLEARATLAGTLIESLDEAIDEDARLPGKRKSPSAWQKLILVR